MKLEINTCEDCLSLLTGIAIPRKVGRGVNLHFDTQYTIEKSDMTILNSIAKQLSKEVPLTDRQYELVKEKLSTYKDQFTKNNNINVEEISKTLKYPLRSIDRSHWVKILDYDDKEVIGIRFPFNKKIISLLDDIKRLQGVTNYKVKDHTHIFDPTPHNIYKVVEIALRYVTKFEIQSDILEAYSILQNFLDNRQDHVPGIYNGVLKNLSDSAVISLKNDVGELDEHSLALYFDRRHLYGIHRFDKQDLEKSLFNYSELSNKIIKRETSGVMIDISRPFDQLVDSLFELKRFPLLIILDEKTAHDDLVTTYKSFFNVIDPKHISVLFRKDGADPFNEYVKDKNINNPVDKHTKIVYINNTKLPKPLLQADWKHKAVMFYKRKGLGFNNITKYSQLCDCQIVCEDDSSSGYFDSRAGKFIHANM
jgi:hypothetical protein